MRKLVWRVKLVAELLNDTLEDAFRHRHPGFRPANDVHRSMTAAA